MGDFFGGGGGQSQTTESKPWEPAIPHLEKILGEMGGWYDSAKNTGYISQTGDLDKIYGQYLNELQQSQQGVKDQTNKLWGQGVNGLEGTQAFYDKMMNGGGAITSADITNMANDFIDNDILQGQIDAANRDTARDLFENQLPNIDREASNNGAMGSSRTSVSAAIAERSANERMADTSAAMRGQAYNNALTQAQNVLTGNLQTQFNAAQGGAANSNSLLNAANGVAGMNNNALNGFLTSAQLQGMLQGANQADKIGQRDFLANLLGTYSNIASGIGGMGGTSTTTASGGGTSGFDKLLQAGATAAMFMSDKRLKKNIKQTGQVGKVKTYTWNWNEVAKEEFDLTGSDRGVIAQEVKEIYPECVEMVDGFYAVNYDRLERILGKKVR